jgi:fatty-acyl-CoA synthase
MVMPDRFLTPEPLAAFIENARPTKGAGVPTVWQGLLTYLEQNPGVDVSSLREAVVGGSACPPSLMHAYEDQLDIIMLHAWGMTEMSPLGTFSRPPADAGGDDAWTYRCSQGRFLPSVEARLVGPDGSVLPHDGESVGELEVRGPWITAAYYGGSEPDDVDPEKFRDGWLRTGDVGTITPDGFLTITDRAKDVIKSGGEWISSVELETHLMAHPAVVEASVVGIPDDRWGERPLATVVVKSGHDATAEELREFLSERVAKWQVPTQWAFISEVPKTSVGKFDKKEVRRRYAVGELEVLTLQ